MTDGKTGKRKKVLKAMPEDNFFRAFFSSPAALAISRIADGKFLNINPSYTNVMGYQPDDILGRTVDDLNIYVDRGERDFLVKTLHEKGEVHNYELNVRNKSGEVRNLLLSMVPTIYDNEEAIISTFIDITAKKLAEEKGRHLSEVLNAIKSINQLINREKDPVALIQKVCVGLTETHGYRSAWICILDSTGKMKASAESGIGPEFTALKEKAENGDLPACCKKAFASKDIAVIRKPMPGCERCTLKGRYDGSEIMAGALRHAGRDYGVLTITVPEGMADDPGEKDLFSQVVGDIGLALDSIDAEQKRRNAEYELQRSEFLYRALFENMLNGFAYCRMIYDGEKPMDFIYLSVNRAFETQTGLKDVVGKRVSEVIPGILEADPGLIETYGRVARSGIPEVFETYVEALRMWFEVTVYSPGRDHFVALFNVINKRKEAEISLRESEAKYRLISENGSDVIWLYDIAAGHFTYVTPSVVRLSGYTVDEVLRQSMKEALTPESYQMVTKGLTVRMAALESGDESARIRTHDVDQPRRDGTIVSTEVVTTLITDAGGRVIKIQGVTRDITERKRIERTLSDREALLQDVGIIAQIGGWEMDLVTGKASWTRTTYDLIGIKPGDPVPGPNEHIGYYVEDDRPVVAEAMRKLVEDDIPMDFEARADIPGKGIRWFRVLGKADWENGRCVRVYGTLQDITDRNMSEIILRESEERFRALVDLAPDGILVHAEGRIMYVNPAMVSILGAKNADDLIGSDFMEKIASEYHDEVIKRLQIQRETGRPVPAMEQEFLRQDGSRVTTESIAAPLRFGGRDAHLVFVRDISLRKSSEEERVNLQSQLQQSQKMEAIGRLAGGVAHDFNNLLTVIIGWSELEMNRLKEDDPLRKRLGEIFKAGKSAASLTRQLLAFSRRQPQNPEVVNINESVRNIEKMLHRLIGENIELNTKLEDGLYRVTVDKGQIEQVLMNIIINAKDAMPAGGRIGLETKNLELDEMSSGFNPEAVPGSYVMVSVSDNGTGMDAETIKRIFEPFFTTKELGKGTGLGLSTVYGIIKQSGGFIDVKSRKGVGTVFKIFLPKSEKEGGRAGAREDEVEAVKGAGILIVEDSTAVRNLTVRMLRDSGYIVSEASSPEEALSFMNEQGEGIDLVVSDIMMPGMTGPEMMERLTADHPGLRHIYMSGYTEQIASFSDTLGDHANFISKPFRRVDFLKKIRFLLKGETLP